jgi:hypothetical protein
MPLAPLGGTPGFFTGGNPGIGQVATVPGYEWFNAVQEELIALILRVGLTPLTTDLTQVRQAIQQICGGDYASVNLNVSLTPANAGVVQMNATAGPRVITLPLSNSMNGRPIRYQIIKADGSANTVTVQASGSDTIEGVTSIQLIRQGESLNIVSDGFNGWLILRGLEATSSRRGNTRFATLSETDAGALSDVAVTPAGLGIAFRNYNNPGYARLVGGLIIQWGFTNSIDIATAGSTVTATFPIAFPNACLNLQGTPRAIVGGGNFSIVDQSFTHTGCNFTLNEWANNAQNVSVAYVAIGW